MFRSIRFWSPAQNFSLALFVFMNPLLEIAGRPAMMALFLGSLMPIVHTHAGLTDLPVDITDAARAVGLRAAVSSSVWHMRSAIRLCRHRAAFHHHRLTPGLAGLFSSPKTILTKFASYKAGHMTALALDQFAIPSN